MLNTSFLGSEFVNGAPVPHEQGLLEEGEEYVYLGRLLYTRKDLKLKYEVKWLDGL